MPPAPRIPTAAGANLAVRWDLNGDGVFDTSPTTAKTHTTRSTEPGIYQVVAELTDENGDSFVSVPIGIRVEGYDFHFSGIKRAPAFNEVQAGKALAVTFKLGDDFGLGIFAAGGPSFQLIACDALGVLDEAIGASGRLLYKAQTNRYYYATKTDPAWAGTCRQLNMRLNDGSNHVVYFQFK